MDKRIEDDAIVAGFGIRHPNEIGGMLFDARVMLAIHGSISERRIESDLTVQDRARTGAPRLLIV
jgi:hypothetical protein